MRTLLILFLVWHDGVRRGNPNRRTSCSCWPTILARAISVAMAERSRPTPNVDRLAKEGHAVHALLRRLADLLTVAVAG